MSEIDVDRQLSHGTTEMMARITQKAQAIAIAEQKAKKRKTRSLRQGTSSALKEVALWLCDNQIGISLKTIVLLSLTHLCLPSSRIYTSKFLWVSHYNPKTGNYAIGSNDFCFLTFCVVLFTGLRAICMKYILGPLARRWGIYKAKDITRFSEQAWLLCYYSVFWTLGVYIYCTSKYYLNLREMFTDWPTRELPQITKVYILGQWAFWLQQLLVINIEERRKDHWQMLAHHIVTIVLMSTSYALHLTRVANLILVLMDVVDIFFPLAKCLKYLGFSTLRDLMFGVFMLSWFTARHVFYIVTMWSIWTHMAEIIPIGCYHGSQDNLTGPTPIPEHGWTHILDPFRNPSGTICYSDSVRWGFLCALGFLQLITIFWFVLIVKVAIRVVKGMGADDIRSDDDETRSDDDRGDKVESPEYNRPPLGVGARAPVLYSRSPKRTAGVGRSASSSGTNLSGQYTRKELLSRIGCEYLVE
ncbi:longevity assurance proteins LAG1/LAC1 [Aspergillus desertorum]